jgi:outer membrane immunogenic protein
MKKLAIALCGAACLMTTPALAQDGGPGLWGSVGYTHIGVEGMSLGAITGRVGAQFNPVLGIEGEGSFGVGSESEGGVEVKLSHDFAGYVTASLPMTDNARLVGRVGYGTTEIEAEELGVSDDFDAGGYRYGVGAEFFFDDSNGVRVDFLRVDAEDSLEADLYTISYVRRFR